MSRLGSIVKKVLKKFGKKTPKQKIIDICDKVYSNKNLIRDGNHNDEFAHFIANEINELVDCSDAFAKLIYKDAISRFKALRIQLSKMIEALEKASDRL
jgi:N-acetylglucosamine kinase-like BadF-type ATPase